MSDQDAAAASKGHSAKCYVGPLTGIHEVSANSRPDVMNNANVACLKDQVHAL